MARLEKGKSPMPADDTFAGTQPPTADGKKRRKPQGPRKPSAIYVFVTVVDGKAAVAQSYRNPRNMAEHIADANANGEQLLVVVPEA